MYVHLLSVEAVCFSRCGTARPRVAPLMADCGVAAPVRSDPFNMVRPCPEQWSRSALIFAWAAPVHVQSLQTPSRILDSAVDQLP